MRHQAGDSLTSKHNWAAVTRGDISQKAVWNYYTSKQSFAGERVKED